MKVGGALGRIPCRSIYTQVTTSKSRQASSWNIAQGFYVSMQRFSYINDCMIGNQMRVDVTLIFGDEARYKVIKDN